MTCKTTSPHGIFALNKFHAWLTAILPTQALLRVFIFVIANLQQRVFLFNFPHKLSVSLIMSKKKKITPKICRNNNHSTHCLTEKHASVSTNVGLGIAFCEVVSMNGIKYSFYMIRARNMSNYGNT